MSYAAKVLADSLNTCGDRLITLELTYPRLIHSEFMTHRVFSRNSASSRAIPFEKMVKRVLDHPVLPVFWGKNQAGMQAYEEIADKDTATAKWLEARDAAVAKAMELHAFGVHKQIVNRLLEPWMWITVVCSGTNFEHFLSLRQPRGAGVLFDPEFPAQPEIQVIASLAYQAINGSQPKCLKAGDWHLPFIAENEWTDRALDWMMLRKVSVARCARVSYLTHDGHRDIQKDIELHDRLATSGHWSCFEHQAEALSESKWIGNFRGFKQYRKEFPNEFVDYKAAA